MNPMPCSEPNTTGESHVLPLVQIIELKWLLAGEGIHIHVGRLQQDASYARQALDQAAASENPCVRAMASRLRVSIPTL
jgi:hypothetical protein